METGTGVQKPQTFEDRLKDKLKTDIGTLMSDEELSALIAKAMERIFFQPRIIDPGGFREKRAPSWFEEEVHHLLKDRMKRMAEEFLDDREDRLREAMIESIRERGPELLASLFLNTAGASIQTAGVDLAAHLTNALHNVNNR